MIQARDAVSSLHLLIGEIERTFTDAEYFNANTRKPDEPEIVADPDGRLGQMLPLLKEAMSIGAQGNIA